MFSCEYCKRPIMKNICERLHLWRNIFVPSAYHFGQFLIKQISSTYLLLSLLDRFLILNLLFFCSNCFSSCLMYIVSPIRPGGWKGRGRGEGGVRVIFAHGKFLAWIWNFMTFPNFYQRLFCWKNNWKLNFQEVTYFFTGDIAKK